MNFNTSILLLAASIFFLLSCKNNGNKDSSKFSEKNGGTFVMAENNQIATLYPLSITSQVEGLITTQIHEALMRLDSKTLEVVPGLTEKWDLSKDGKTITFHLVKGAHFQDDKCYKDGKGPEITTKDVKYTLELIATKTEENYQFNTILKDRLVGVNDFYDKKSPTISGIKIIDDYTFSLELVNPSLSFLKLLANPSASIVNEIAIKTYGKDLKTGAGPFQYDVSSTNEKNCTDQKPKIFPKRQCGQFSAIFR